MGQSEGDATKRCVTCMRRRARTSNLTVVASSRTTVCVKKAAPIFDQEHRSRWSSQLPVAGWPTAGASSAHGALAVIVELALDELEDQG